MDRSTAIFVDGLGAAAAPSRILSRPRAASPRSSIFRPGRSRWKTSPPSWSRARSNVSVNIRGLVEWHLVRRTRVALPQGPLRGGHRLLARDAGDHGAPLPVEPATGAGHRRRDGAGGGRGARAAADRAGLPRAQARGPARLLCRRRRGIGAFAQGKFFAPETVQNVFRLGAPRSGERS